MLLVSANFAVSPDPVVRCGGNRFEFVAYQDDEKLDGFFSRPKHLGVFHDLIDPSRDEGNAKLPHTASPTHEIRQLVRFQRQKHVIETLEYPFRRGPVV